MVEETEVTNRLWASRQVYCTVCHRYYPAIACRFDLAQKKRLCFYEDCTGELLRDAVPWLDVRKPCPNFPATPQLGVVYLIEGQGRRAS